MNSSTDFKPVLTKAALALQRKNQNCEFKALVFEEPKMSVPSKADDSASTVHQPMREGRDTHTPKRKEEAEEFDIKKARNEVLRFAINNQRSLKSKKKMETFQLIKMGMKPPKKPYKNYKILLDERKRLKQIREERKKFHELGKNQTGRATVNCRTKTQIDKQKKKRAPVTGINQHYGVVKPKLKKKK